MAQVIHGDCLEVLKTLPDNSVDAVVTDPPAGIAFMNKDWDKDKGGRDNWIAWMGEVAAECLRVVKPGGHAIVWALPRTSHWTGTAWENGGWEPRDKIVHLFGSGFPKSLGVSKAIDKAAGAERAIVGDSKYANKNPNGHKTGSGMGKIVMCAHVTAPATDDAKQWDGWGTALKPAHEDYWLFRKPIKGTVANNVLEWGTGGLNIDDCRVEASDGVPLFVNGVKRERCRSGYDTGGSTRTGEISRQGRFPANVIHDGSPEVLAVFPESKQNGYRKNPSVKRDQHDKYPYSYGSRYQNNYECGERGYDDTGSAARFFYCAKASKRDRDEGLDGFEKKDASKMSGGEETRHDRPTNHPLRANHHPTVKNTELMRYLCRLITPPGGLILDPFCGSGSTGKGAMLEGFDFIGIEQDGEYCEIARARIAYVEPVKEPTLEERVQWLETQVKHQGNQLKKIQHQQLSIFG